VVSLDISSSSSLVGFTLVVEEYFVYVSCVVVDPSELVDDFTDGGVFVVVVREEGAFESLDGSWCDSADVGISGESVVRA
jgi:hypothetical protein